MDRALYGLTKLEVGIRGLPRVNVGLVAVGLVLGYTAPTILHLVRYSLFRIKPFLANRIKKAMNGINSERDVAACMENLQTTVDKLR
jgi:hypothetical protein